MNNSSANFNELFEQAARMFENTLKAGIAVQQESTKWFADTLRGMASPQQWQSKNQAAMEQASSTIQNSVDEAIAAMNDNAKTSLDLLEKAFMVHHNGSEAANQTGMREVWETAIGALRRNIEMTVHANARVIESWGTIVKMMCGEATRQASEMSRKAGEAAQKAVQS